MKFLFLVSFLRIALAQLPPVYNVLDYGAVGDGHAMDTVALRSALLAAVGGGVVLLPAPYVFLTGCVNLTSNIELRVEGTLKASSNSSGGNFVLIEPLAWYGGGQDRQLSGDPEWQSVVHSYNAVNVSITGGGLIDGNGGAADGWWACFHASPALGPPPCSGFSRPPLVRFVNTNGVLVRDVTLRDSPAWTIHLANVSGALVTNVSVTAPADEGNTDGVDVDCSDSVVIDKFYYAGGDDAIAVKSGIDWPGRTFGRASRDVLITSLVVEAGNGIAIGSEESASVHNVTFDGVLISTARLGLHIKHGPYMKTQRGRGGTVSNITFKNLRVEGDVGFAIGLTLNYHPGLPPTNSSATPHFEGIAFENFSSHGCSESFSFSGLNDSVITGVSFVNVSTDDHGIGSTCEFSQGVCDALTNNCPPCFNRFGGR